MSERPRQTNSKWVPSLGEIIFAAVLAWLFLGGTGAVALLGDGDTGWHIRTGEYILANKTFPKQDLFSFSRAGQPWFAWEWLSDVALAVVHAKAGLPGVVLLAGILIAATSALLFRYMIWQGSNLLVAVGAMLMASSASTIHWLARPHLISYLFLAVSMWALEADRRRPSPRIYALVALAALWTNLHGGFGALVVTVGLYLAGSVAQTFWSPRRSWDWTAAKRYGLLLAGVAGATLVNPYTYQLHGHIWQYLRSDFILSHVQEFQSPSFRGEGMRHFELLLFAGLAAAPALLRRREVIPALLIVFWAHQALTSARHVLLYVVVAAPIVAHETTLLLDRAAEAGIGWVRTIREIAQDYGAGVYGSGRGPAWAWLAPLSVVAVGAVLLGAPRSERLRAEFSRLKFPVEACAFAGPDLLGKRIFTSDQWGDYLIYRYYPRLKVFIDGRSDFYGPELGRDYLRAMNAHHQWEQIFDRHGFEVALLPAEWPLSTTIKRHPGWRLKYDDGRALLLERVRPASAADRTAGDAATSRRGQG